MRRTFMAVTLAAVALALNTLAAGSAAATTATALPAALSSAEDSLSPACSADYFDGDYRLGPANLPDEGLVGFELIGYRRGGDLTTDQLLARYYDTSAKSWIYPPASGYVVVGGVPLESVATLLPGQDVDRFGSEYGSFLAPEGLPYAMRSIPPQSLDGDPAAGCNYHDYRVLRPFAVESGPIAPWFGQPGYGLQYQLVAGLIPGGPSSVNVGWLVANGYLQRLV